MRNNYCVSAAYLMAMKDTKIALLKRKNTGYHDGEYSFIAGHIERNESPSLCIIREAKEEAGIEIEENDLKLVHIMYRKRENDNTNERIDFIYKADKWSGNIVNNEIEKCESIDWFNIIDIPNNIIPFVRAIIEEIEKGNMYSEYGWEKKT